MPALQPSQSAISLKSPSVGSLPRLTSVLSAHLSPQVRVPSVNGRAWDQMSRNGAPSEDKRNSALPDNGSEVEGLRVPSFNRAHTIEEGGAIIKTQSFQSFSLASRRGADESAGVDEMGADKTKKKRDASCFSKIRAPLWFIMMLQIILILATFMTVVVVTTETDRRARIKALKGELHRQMSLLARDTMTPFHDAERTLRIFRDQMARHPGEYRCAGDASHSHPHIPTYGSSKRFLHDALTIHKHHPTVVYVYQMVSMQSDIRDVQGRRELYHCGASPDYYNLCGGGQCQKYHYNSMEAALSGAFSQVTVPQPTMLWSRTYINHTAMKVYDVRWLIYTDYKTSDGQPAVIFTIAATFYPGPESSTIQLMKNHSIWSVGITLNVDNTRYILMNNTVNDPGAHTTLYAHFSNAVLAATRISAERSIGANLQLMSAGKTGDEGMDRAYKVAERHCPRGKRCWDIQIVREEGYITVFCTIGVINSIMNLLLVQEVPEDYYLGEIKREQLRLLLIGVSVAVAIALSMVAILVALHRPIASLKVNFELAAILQNDKVEHTSSFFTDIMSLSVAFDTMNEKLIVARAFMPQAYLEDNDGDMDEGDVEAMVPSSAASSKRGSLIEGSGMSAVASTIITTVTTTTVSSNQEARIMARMTLSQKKVAVLALNLINFHRLARDPLAILSTTEKLATIIQGSASAGGGILDSFHGDRFVITFNATKAAALPGKRAVLCALELRNLLGQLLTRPYGGAIVSMGVAQGTAMVGSLGNSSLQRFSIVGQAYGTAIGLERASKRLQLREGHRWGWGIGAFAAWCLTTDNAIGDAETVAIFQALGRMWHPSLPAQLPNTLSRCQLVPVYGVVCGMPAQGDEEWLYQLSDSDDSNALLRPNRAFKSLLEGNAQAAQEMLNAFDQTVVSTISESFSADEITSMSHMALALAYVKRLAQRIGLPGDALAEFHVGALNTHNSAYAVSVMDIDNPGQEFECAFANAIAVVASFGPEGAIGAASIVAWERLRVILTGLMFSPGNGSVHSGGPTGSPFGTPRGSQFNLNSSESPFRLLPNFPAPSPATETGEVSIEINWV